MKKQKNNKYIVKKKITSYQNCDGLIWSYWKTFHVAELKQSAKKIGTKFFHGDVKGSLPLTHKHLIGVLAPQGGTSSY